MEENRKVLDQAYWNNHWENKETGWDIGRPSPPITEYIDQHEGKEEAILIPGCGNAHEAAYLLSKGFTNITLVDFAPKAVERLQTKFEENKEIKIVCQDFFEHEGSYDLIIEQTFFCANLPESRPDYVRKMASLLKKKGKLVGVLFDRKFPFQGPPFGGTRAEYRRLFKPFFKIKILEDCYNSIPQRLGTEVFIKMIKK